MGSRFLLSFSVSACELLHRGVYPSGFRLEPRF